MPRANRLGAEGGIFHLTHRCHNGAFLLKFDRDRDAYRAKLWEQEVFNLLLAEGTITEEIVANIRSWPDSGFSVDQSVRMEAQDTEGLQRLIEYFLSSNWGHIATFNI